MIRKFLAVTVAALMMTVGVADAKSRFSSFRSSSNRSSYTKTYTPRPVYRSTTVQNNTYIQQNSGGGMLNSFVGSFGGIAAYNWLFGEDEKPVETPAAVPVVPPVETK